MRLGSSTTSGAQPYPRIETKGNLRRGHYYGYGSETDLVQLRDELPDVGVHPEGKQEDAGELAQ